MVTLSIICPTYNEEKYIASTITSFLQQEFHSFELEILIVDGRSTDNTRNIVTSFCKQYPFIKLVDNPNQKTPYAFNEGLQHASGAFIAILGAHTSYAKNYLQACYDALLKSNSVGCTGRVLVQALSNNTGAQLSEWVTNSVFGVSGASFRAMKEGYVHSVNFPVFKKQALIELGGYNVTLIRNQDNDMNQRLLDAGHKLYCTWDTVAYYRPPANVNALLKYAYRNGFWNAISIFKNARSMRLHHLIPFLFVSCIILGLVVGTLLAVFMQTNLLLLLILFGVSLHLLIGFVVSILSFATQKDFRKFLMPFVFFAFHFKYGWGTLNGFLQSKKYV
jgi:glycosyltransferase involved in cell wall biosynthesis